MSLFCSQCGKQVDEKATFCPYCGSPINAKGNAATRSTPPPSGTNASGYGYSDPNQNGGAYSGGGAAAPNNPPGKGKATAALVLGIISVVFAWFGYSSLVSLVTGIAGLILAATAKRDGYVGGMRTAGFVLSLIGLIFGAIMFISCVACAGVFFLL